MAGAHPHSAGACMAVPEPTTTHTVNGNDGIGIKELPASPEQKLLPPPARRRSWRGLLFLIAVAIGGYYGHRYYQDRQAAKTAADRQQAHRAAPRAGPVAGIPGRRGHPPGELPGPGTRPAVNPC